MERVDSIFASFVADLEAGVLFGILLKGSIRDP